MKRYFETTNRKLELIKGDWVILKMFGEKKRGMIIEGGKVSTGIACYSLDYITSNHNIKKER